MDDQKTSEHALHVLSLFTREDKRAKGRKRDETVYLILLKWVLLFNACSSYYCAWLIRALEQIKKKKNQSTDISFCHTATSALNFIFLELFYNNFKHFIFVIILCEFISIHFSYKCSYFKYSIYLVKLYTLPFKSLGAEIYIFLINYYLYSAGIH